MTLWSELPYDLIGKIAQQVEQVEDFVTFSCVCTSWRSNAVKENRSPERQLPWLMLAEDPNDNNEDGRRGFYNLHARKRLDLALPEARGKRCWGCRHGWISTLSTDQEISLLNPLTRARISLPPPSAFDPPPDADECPIWFRDCFISKMAVFRDEEEGDGLIVVAIFGCPSRRLGFVRPGEKAWTTVADSERDFVDMTVLNGHLYAADRYGAIYMYHRYDLECPKAVLVASAPMELGLQVFPIKIHLVDYFGELLVVARDREIFEEDWKTVWFVVYKLDWKTNKWVDVEDFGDCAIFVGANCSIALNLGRGPGRGRGCGSNKIYFTDDECVWSEEYPGGQDMGVFDMEDESFHSHYEGDNILTAFCAPFWIVPTLY